MQEINKLRAHLAQLATERKSLSERISTMYARRNELGETITQANMALNDRAKRWQEVDSLTATREAAKRERADLEPKIQAAERKDITLSERERDYRKDLAQAEYLNTTASDVQAEIEATLAEVRDADARLASLAAERASLTVKRGQATRAAAAVRAAEGELVNARQAQETASGQAFVEGREVDLVPYSARIAKGEKRLDEARREAAAGVAALPLIDKKLALLAAQVEGTEEGRAAAIKSYWHAQARLLEIEWRQKIENLVETAILFRALDAKTGRPLGTKLYESVLGLRVPATVNDDYPQPVKLVEPDNRASLDRLENELEAALAEEVETV
ncbi:MAG: hypothetical protein V4554_03785 [Pseudomonadota bacterium]